MFTIGYFIAALVYPHLAYMSVVLRLFKVDTAKGSIPRDPLAVERATPQDLLLAAQTRLKERKKMPTNYCVIMWHHFTQAIHLTLCCCRSNKFFRSLEQGKQ